MSEQQMHDEGAERAVLGSMLVSADAVVDVLGVVTPADFWQPRHQLIAAAAFTLARRGVGVDAIAVGDELGRTGDLLKAGGYEYLLSSKDHVTAAANAGYHAGIVRDWAARRRLLEAGQRIVQTAASGGDPARLIAAARADVDGAASAAIASLHWVGEDIDQLASRITAPTTLMRTPWLELDRYLGGFAPGRFYVIGARPGVGKSVVALQCARALADHGRVGYISAEMTREELQTRLVASMGSVSLRALTDGPMTDSDWRGFAAARPAIQTMPLAIEDAYDSLDQVEAYARRMHREGGMAGLVVDYLQLLNGAAGVPREEQISTMSRAMKQMAKSLQIPVIALAQLNREGAQRKGKDSLPKITDLRGSGSLEQDADVVVLMHREVEQQSKRLQMFVPKNRHGQTGDLSLVFEGPFSRAVSRVHTHEDAVLDGMGDPR